MLNQDYKEMLLCLEKHNVKHILVGAYAIAAHGYPRSTNDIDIWVRPDPVNSANTYAALAEFGSPLHQISAETFIYPGVVFQIGVAPCRIDILTKISGDIEFDDAMDHCATCVIDSVTVRVLSIDDLITNKSATGRPKDIEDVKALRNLNSN